jgi:hypothetical protein
MDGQGVAKFVVGEAPDTGQLGEVAGVTVDATGLLYAADRRTGAVHVFDQTGTHRRLCKPAASDFKGQLIRPDLAVAPDGAVFLGGDMMEAGEKPRHIHFAPNGRRIGTKSLGVDDITEKWHPLPDGNILVAGLQEAFIVNQKDRVIRTIQRRPDQNWLEYLKQTSIAADGSFAILSVAVRRDSSPFVSIYTDAGEPARAFPVPEAPFDCFAYTGKHIVLRVKDELWLVSPTGEPELRFRPDAAGFKEGSCACFAVAGGRELWLTDSRSKTVARYEMP